MPNQPPEPTENPGDEHDRWADVVAAAGYDDAAPAPIYTGKRDASAATDARRLDSLFAADAGPAARAADTPADAEVPAAGASRAAWDESWESEDDVVLRAFEAHASAEPAHAALPGLKQSDDRAAMDELLGEGADDLVEEAQVSPVEGSFPAGSPSRQPMPWDDPTPPPAPVAVTGTGWDRTDAVDLPDDDPAAYAGASAPPAPYDFLPDEQEGAAAVVFRSRRRRGRTVARELVETLLLALLVFLAVRASFQNFKVDGSSMYPTLENGEFLIVNKLVYSEVDVEKLGRFLPFLDAGERPRRFVFHGPERGDIIVLEDPAQPGVDLIKRVVGLPNETIEIVNGTIFINGRPLEEPYIDQPWHYTGPLIAIGPGEYFVMGDNRDNSKDSRSFGPVPKDLIIGKALLTYWPSSSFGLAPNGSPHLGETSAEAAGGEDGVTPATP